MFSRWRNDNEAAALDQLWDQLQAADGSRPRGANERPDDAEAIELVRAHDDAPRIDPIFSATLLKDLTTMHAQQRFGIHSNGYGALAATTSRLPAASQRPWIGERDVRDGRPRLRLVAGLAVLALLLALGAGSLWPERASEPPAIPAAVMQDPYGIESETLVDISFPAGRLRGDDGAQLVFGEMRVPPGTGLDFLLACDSHTIYPFYVLEGTLATDVAGTSFVLRAGTSSWETIPAGETAEMYAGDIWYFENTSEDGMSNLRNPGTEDLRYLWVGARQNVPECDGSPPSGQHILWDQVEDPSGPIDPTQPVRLVLRSVTMPVGSEMEGDIAGMSIPSAEQEAMGGRQWVEILSGDLSVTRESDGEDGLETITLPQHTAVMLTQEMTRSSEGERVVLLNASDVAVELLVLDIVVGDTGTQGGVAAPPAASPVASPAANP